MTQEYSLGETSIADGSQLAIITARDLFFDPTQTIISQYANSPIITALIADFAQWIDQKTDFDQFVTLVWNVSTAVGYGLDVWGRIVGVSRVLQVAASTYLGFQQQTEAQTFGHGIFFSGGVLTSNYALTDEAYRQLIYAKALLNITDCSIPSINAILLRLFGSYGNVYVQDNGDMTISYNFPSTLAPVDRSIVFQSGVLPKPVGVSYTVVE